MIRAIIFDCFGVIITDALQAVVSELEESNPQAAREVIDIIHANNRGLINPAESNKQIANILNITTQEFRERIQQGEVKDERVLRYIREIRGKYKTALLSNIGRQSLHRRFTDEELKTHFEVVIVSGDLGVMKPDPEIYLHTAEKLGVEPRECVFIDDREGHCTGARSTGMQAILYTTLAACKEQLAPLLADTKN